MVSIDHLRVLAILPLVNLYFFLFDFEFPSDAAQHLLNGHTFGGAFVLLDWGLISSILFYLSKDYLVSFFFLFSDYYSLFI